MEIKFDSFFEDFFKRRIRFSWERKSHIENTHPEMSGETDKIRETLQNPDKVVKSKVDANVELFYRNYKNTPIGEKYLCVVVKNKEDDNFIITSYFTDTVKKGELLWQKR